jgi:hypothetical protein
MVVIGIDDRATPRHIGGDHDCLILQLESPALRVVAGGRKCGVAHQILHGYSSVSAHFKRASQGAGERLLVGL